MDKGLPSWCWGGYVKRLMDNLLQYILEVRSVSEGHLLIVDHQKTEAERKLCLELARRFSLEELCYQNEHRQNALYYAVKFVDALQESPWHHVGDGAPAWIEVGDTIRQQMELRVREFQGSLMELVALTASVLDALEGKSLPAKLMINFDSEQRRSASSRELAFLRLGRLALGLIHCSFVQCASAQLDSVSALPASMLLMEVLHAASRSRMSSRSTKIIVACNVEDTDLGTLGMRSRTHEAASSSPRERGGHQRHSQSHGSSQVAPSSCS
eukprot:Skav222240  [mRNA]  locus=scaffold3059:158577:160385:- [translate_table: standard]